MQKGDLSSPALKPQLSHVQRRGYGEISYHHQCQYDHDLNAKIHLHITSSHPMHDQMRKEGSYVAFHAGADAIIKGGKTGVNYFTDSKIS